MHRQHSYLHFSAPSFSLRTKAVCAMALLNAADDVQAKTMPSQPAIHESHQRVNAFCVETWDGFLILLLLPFYDFTIFKSSRVLNKKG
jgi:hypothetical protein